MKEEFHVVGWSNHDKRITLVHKDGGSTKIYPRHVRTQITCGKLYIITKDGLKIFTFEDIDILFSVEKTIRWIQKEIKTEEVFSRMLTTGVVNMTFADGHIRFHLNDGSSIGLCCDY